MKDIFFVQRNWKMSFFEPISEGLSADVKSQIRYELGKEVDWMVQRSLDGSSFHAAVASRLNKIDRLIFVHDDPSRFDQFYNYRKALFEYVLAS